jgi:hypothetical protein
MTDERIPQEPVAFSEPDITAEDAEAVLRVLKKVHG